MSVFLIVVVLLGVFFSMGYIVGRNTPAASAAEVAARPGKPIIVDNPSKENSSKPASAVDEGAPGQAANPPVETKPSPVPAVEAPPARKKEIVGESAPKPAEGEPGGGQTFLQVVATSGPDSELIAETLAKKGFHTRVAPGPSPALFRVLVGPLDGAADIAETRVRLEASGFKNPYVRKY